MEGKKEKYEDFFEELAGSEDEGCPQFEEQAFTNVSNETEKWKQKVYEERFIWGFVAVILFDAHIFTQMDTWGGPVTIGFLEVILLLILGDKLGLTLISEWITKILSSVNNRSE